MFFIMKELAKQGDFKWRSPTPYDHCHEPLNFFFRALEALRNASRQSGPSALYDRRSMLHGGYFLGALILSSLVVVMLLGPYGVPAALFVGGL
jgi:hypothetical protein